MVSETILVTGATGFLGKIICQELVSDYTVDTLSRSSNNTYRVDLAREIPIFEKQFRTIVHAAGKAHVIPQTKKEENEFYETNVLGTRHLVDALERSGRLPLEFVFISSVAVYGLEEGELITEDFALLGETPYAKSKIQAEVYLLDWCKANSVRLTILRLPLLVGQNPPGNLGAMIRMMNRGLYLGIGSGSARKSMVLATEVAKFIPKVAQTGGIYNLTDGYHPSVFEFENEVAKALGRSKPFRFPDSFINTVAKVGDVWGERFPVNSNKFKKLTTSLTFSDGKARELANWQSLSVIDHLPNLR